MAYETLQLTFEDGVAFLTLNRPNAANALGLTMARELFDAALQCQSRPAVRAVVLTGAGSAFCAGGDVKGFGAAGAELPAMLAQITAHLHAAVARFARMDAPLITAVNGVAAGAGMSLACTGDIVLAAESARFTMAYTRIGLTPDGSSTFYLTRLVGLRRAQELLLTNRLLPAAEALAWGLVTRVVPDAELAAEAAKLARQIAAGPTRAFGGVKRLLLAAATTGLETQMEYETREIVQAGGSADGQEGVAAFAGKRPPRFTGA
jgi:2-(1,2-epoxy-1,2-dihydrophenyl)acetyl-CoA isomerase